MPPPRIVIDDVFGSDTQASGCGPGSDTVGSAGLFGSAARTRPDGSNRVGLFDATTLAGVMVYTSAPQGYSGNIWQPKSVFWSPNVGGSGREFVAIDSVRDSDIQFTMVVNGGTTHTMTCASLTDIVAGDVFYVPASGTMPAQYAEVATATESGGVRVIVPVTPFSWPSVSQSVTVRRPRQVGLAYAIDGDQGLSWAIGGRRKTISGSSKAFYGDNLPGWTISLMNNGNPYIGGINAALFGAYPTPLSGGWVEGDALAGSVLIEGKNGTFKGRVEIRSIDGCPLTVTHGSFAVFKKLFFNHYGVGTHPSVKITSGGSSVGGWLFDDCEFSSAIGGGSGIGILVEPSLASTTGQLRLSVQRCYFHNCADGGIKYSGTHAVQMYGFRAMNCFFKQMGGPAISIAKTRDVTIFGCLASDCAGGIYLLGSGAQDCGMARLIHNTIDGNGRTGDGIRITGVGSKNGLEILNNIITRHVGWGINAEAGGEDLYLADHNCIPTEAGWSNSSGQMTGITHGEHLAVADPGFANPAGDDFSVGSPGCQGSGYPPSGVPVALNSNTYTAVDLGAAQSRSNAPFLRLGRNVR